MARSRWTLLGRLPTPQIPISLVRIRLKRPFEGRRKFVGQLRGLEGDEVVVGFEGEEIIFPYEEIERANVVPDI